MARSRRSTPQTPGEKDASLPASGGEEGAQSPLPPLRPDLLAQLDDSSTLVLRNLQLFGRRTSIRLEREMWNGLDEICRREDVSLAVICEILARAPRQSNLTAAIRVFILLYFRGPSRPPEAPGVPSGPPNEGLSSTS